MEIAKSYNENSIRNYDEKFIQKYTEAINKLKLRKTSIRSKNLLEENDIVIKNYTGKYGKGKIIKYLINFNEYNVIEYWIE